MREELTDGSFCVTCYKLLYYIINILLLQVFENIYSPRAPRSRPTGACEKAKQCRLLKYETVLL